MLQPIFSNNSPSVSLLKKSAVGLYGVIVLFNNYNKIEKLYSFLDCLKKTHDIQTIPEVDRTQFRDLVNSKYISSKLLEYAKRSTEIDSRIGHMALALLHYNVYYFDESTKSSLLNSLPELTDDTIQFFIHCIRNVEKQSIENLPYHRVSISRNSSLLNLDKKYNPEYVSLNIIKLKNLGLILEDPCSGSPYASKGDEWLVEYGISENMKQIANLLDTARSLCR